MKYSVYPMVDNHYLVVITKCLNGMSLELKTNFLTERIGLLILH